MLAGTPTSSALPATIEVKALERAAVRCNIQVHQYVASGNVLETIRPGGVVTVDTVSESFALAIYPRDSSIVAKAKDSSAAIIERVKQIVASSSVKLHNCSIPNDGAYVNAFDQPVEFTCPADQVMVGESSYHNNEPEDRQYRFRCCSIAVIPAN